MNLRFDPAQFRKQYGGPPACLGRYSYHLSGWTDEQGQNRCRRCHAVLPPKGQRASYEAYSQGRDGKPWSEARKSRRERTVAQREAVKPRPTVHRPECRHPPPLTDPASIHADAQKRMDAFEKQRECPVCHDWVFEGLFNPPQECPAPLASANPSDFDTKKEPSCPT
jgi:hypothetical protein